MPELTLTEFAAKIDEVMPAVMKGFARKQTNALYKGKITLPQFFILSHLNRHGDSIMKDLASVMEVSTPAATGIVERLVRDRYVTRVFDPKDRRVIHIRLTQSGANLVKKMDTQRRQLTLEVFGKISQQERENYLSILMHIKDVLSENNAA